MILWSILFGIATPYTTGSFWKKSVQTFVQFKTREVTGYVEYLTILSTNQSFLRTRKLPLGRLWVSTLDWMWMWLKSLIPKNGPWNSDGKVGRGVFFLAQNDDQQCETWFCGWVTPRHVWSSFVLTWPFNAIFGGIHYFQTQIPIGIWIIIFLHFSRLSLQSNMPWEKNPPLSLIIPLEAHSFIWLWINTY